MTTIYHNPRCSKSRQTLALLTERGITPEVIRYLDNPPNAATLAQLTAMLGNGIRAVLRTNEVPYRELNLGDSSLSERALIDAVVAHPILLERPIVVHGNRAVLCRPPENVVALLAQDE